ADLKWRLALAAKLRIQVAQTREHLDGRRDRLVGVIGTRPHRIEVGHQPVAQELIDIAALFFDRPSERRKEAMQKLEDALRRHTGGAAREPANVREKNGYLQNFTAQAGEALKNQIARVGSHHLAERLAHILSAL